MITVTPQAAEQILKSAQQAGLKEACLRLAARLGDKGALEYGMGFDDKAEDDVQVAARDITLLISPGSVELLSGATLDYVEINPGEPRFIFINPNDPSHKPPGPARSGPALDGAGPGS
jgi:iron-sulfur cluster assembly protein